MSVLSDRPILDSEAGSAMTSPTLRENQQVEDRTKEASKPEKRPLATEVEERTGRFICSINLDLQDCEVLMV
jgi:hypothetical protein